ncbi:MAG: ATP-binding cassette domain-containing protein [Sphaerochaetaceae bacterium]|nr:ATP-binding cassette domain-containing protein [Sphaerochaetaceae bacterium]MDC7250602.1 ATP-binding cassette domain-containing protein [Sphaerochaetaceae bacterium]
MNTLELVNINLKFNNKEILKNFSLTINSKDKILISANSGKGKSTLLKLLLGFEVQDSGKYLIDGKAIKEYSFFEVRKIFSYVDQDVSLRKIKSRDYIEEISKFNGNNLTSSIDTELCKYFEFDLSLLDKNIQKLSGGERARLAIIIAIMLKRPFYLLDEVTAALDSNLKSKVVSYFNNCEEGVIVISHDDIWMKDTNFRKVSL